MKYQELLDLVGKRNKVPTLVGLMGRQYKIAADKHGDVIDYYCGGDALSEDVAKHYMQQQAELELTVVEMDIRIKSDVPD